MFWMKEMDLRLLLLILLIVSFVNAYSLDAQVYNSSTLEKSFKGTLLSEKFSKTGSIFLNFLNPDNLKEEDLEMDHLQKFQPFSRSASNQIDLSAAKENREDLLIHSQNQEYAEPLFVESTETIEPQYYPRTLTEDKSEYENGDNEDVIEDQVEKYVKEGIDESILSILYNDYWAINYFQSPAQGDKVFDPLYTHVPSHLIYFKTFNNKTYRIIRFPRECAAKAQRVIQRSFWYYCQDRKVFVGNYIKMQQSGYNCYKRKYYTERCLCPLDKFGVYCSQQSKLVCSSGLSIGKNEVIKTSQSCNGVCPSEVSKNKRSGLYSASFTSLTDGDQKMIDFKVYLDCHNSIPPSHRLNEIYYKIEGICPESLGNKEDSICDIKPFEYSLNKTDKGILLSDPLRVKIQVSLANWLHISQPLQLERTIESATVDVLSGEKPANLLVDLETIQDNGVDIHKYLQFGKLWYKMETTVIMNPDDTTEINVTVQKFNGLIQIADYKEPKMSYLERLWVQKIGLELILVITSCIALLALAGGILLFFFKQVKKCRLLKRRSI